MDLATLYNKALNLEFLSEKEGLELYDMAPTQELIAIGHELRKKQVPGNKVTWLIDRNVNITNVCYSQCKFCNFYRKPNSSETYVTSLDDYKVKIDFFGISC